MHCNGAILPLKYFSGNRFVFLVPPPLWTIGHTFFLYNFLTTSLGFHLLIILDLLYVSVGLDKTFVYQMLQGLPGKNINAPGCGREDGLTDHDPPLPRQHLQRHQ